MWKTPKTKTSVLTDQWIHFWWTTWIRQRKIEGKIQHLTHSHQLFWSGMIWLYGWFFGWPFECGCSPGGKTGLQIRKYNDNHMHQYDMIWYDMIRYDMIRCDMIWQDMIYDVYIYNILHTMHLYDFICINNTYSTATRPPNWPPKRLASAGSFFAGLLIWDAHLHLCAWNEGRKDRLRTQGSF